MVVKVVSQQQFNYSLDKKGINDWTVSNLRKTLFISILDSSGMKSHFSVEHDNVLILKFDDLTDEEFERTNLHGKGYILFGEEHAKKIIKFLERNKEKEYCLVHCAAGVSRSGAVGTFINDFFSRTDYFTFMKENSSIKPNAYILSTLKKVYYESDSSN
jgi:predicted protein tyrosine phosphatase